MMNRYVSGEMINAAYAKVEALVSIELIDIIDIRIISEGVCFTGPNIQTVPDNRVDPILETLKVIAQGHSKAPKGRYKDEDDNFIN